MGIGLMGVTVMRVAIMRVTVVRVTVMRVNIIPALHAGVLWVSNALSMSMSMSIWRRLNAHSGDGMRVCRVTVGAVLRVIVTSVIVMRVCIVLASHLGKLIAPMKRKRCIVARGRVSMLCGGSILGKVVLCRVWAEISVHLPGWTGRRVIGIAVGRLGSVIVIRGRWILLVVRVIITGVPLGWEVGVG